MAVWFSCVQAAHKRLVLQYGEGAVLAMMAVIASGKEN
jgi:hypothetical protein